MPPDRIHSEHQLTGLLGHPHHDSHPGEDVLEDRCVVREQTFELHPELAERPTRNDDDPVVDAGLHECTGEDQRVDRSGTERLDVAAARLNQAGGLRDGLAETSAAALIAVADRLLARSHHVGDRLGIDPRVVEQEPGRVHSARLAREVLEQHLGRQRLVERVVAGEGADDVLAVIQRQLYQGPGPP